MASIERYQDNKGSGQFKNITIHEGPLTPKHPNWKESRDNIMIAWENGELSSEPLHIKAADSLAACAIYSKRAIWSIPRVGCT